MKRWLLAGLALLGALASGAAMAHVSVGVAIGVPGVVVGGPAYYPPPAYVAGPPVVMAPAPVYYGPPPVVVRPAPVYYGPGPAYYGPRYYGRGYYGRGYYGRGYYGPPGHGHDHRHWR
ncbi:hypothetical protein [Cupriavidus basilensis]|uniref:hypothetical protein n=1 Tax=Cupriavidus basilensis TaxID=68895 RepID=UPI0023E7D61F|nr:hypothetical protein [Cupriavidus basilensis]MDF3883452.1 hypothetical protein [Cupriavidus basilensis]